MDKTNFDQPVFTMVRKADWDTAVAKGKYVGSADDRRDGFLHFSTASQIEVSAAKHRAGEKDLVLVAVDPAAVGEKLIWEPSRDDALFPHLYGALEMNQVAWVKDLPLGDHNIHVFPELKL